MEVELLLVGIEFLSSVVDFLDSQSMVGFTSVQVAAGLGLGRRYVAQRLSRFRESGLLIRIELPRTIRAGYHRGTFNLYFLTPRARSRVEWWKRKNSLFALNHLATGIGSTEEIFWNGFVEDMQARGIIQARAVKPNNCDRDGLSKLLARLGQPNLANLCAVNLTDEPIGIVLALQKNHLIPESVLKDSALFLTVAKNCWGFSRTEILLALLYRSLAAWKEEADRRSAGSGGSSQSPASGDNESIKGLRESVERFVAKEKRKEEERTTANLENLFLDTCIRDTALDIDEEILAISKQVKQFMSTVNDPYVPIAKNFFNIKLIELVWYISIVTDRLLARIRAGFGFDS